MVTFYHYYIYEIIYTLYYTPDPVTSQYSSFSLVCTEMQFASASNDINDDYYSQELDHQNKTKVF